MGPFIHLVADYGATDPAFSEVVHRLTAEDPTVTVQATAVEPFSTVATGFWLEQLALHNPAFDDLLVYSNTAPRTAETTPDQPDEGGPLCYLELDNGVPVIAVDAGYNLSFVKDHVSTIHEVETPGADGQFRSRDAFPKRVVELAHGDTSSLGAERDIDASPEPPGSVVCHVDGYGNVKTSVRTSEFAAEDGTVSVTCNAATHDVAVRDAIGAVEPDELALVPGSAGGADPYLELVVRGGSAAALFDDPGAGDKLGGMA